jgi:uncharacterized protein with PQ loop repeat
MTVNEVGFMAFLITVTYTSFGLPLQIKENFKRKSTKGQSPLMVVLLFFTFISWVVYGTLIEDWFIVGSNAPGALCIAVVLVQFILYRKVKQPG